MTLVAHACLAAAVAVALPRGCAALARNHRADRAPTQPRPPDDAIDNFSPERDRAARRPDFFGMTTEVCAKAVQNVFSEDHGQPDGYIKGDEGSGAFVVGLRYGSGWLIRKGISRR